MEKESPLRILVVEDEALMRWAIAEALKPGGHTILQASDGAAALAVLHDPSAADVVLLDYHLPDSHDVALLARIRRVAPLIPVVLMTAFGTPTLFAEARKRGATAILSKPFDVYELEGVLRNARRAVH